MAALAAVRDADIQGNVNRYIAETANYTKTALSYGQPWSTLRQAVWYWTRIFILNTPVRIMWWPNGAELDRPPQYCDAPADFPYPVSDPAPAGPPAPSSSWPLREWRELGSEMIGLGIGGHLTLANDNGFPLPFRATSTALVDDGFDLEIPDGAPWRPEGVASLCFMGAATFIGNVTKARKHVHFKVERVLPVLPMVRDPVQLFAPSPELRTSLMDRMQKELARRGQKTPEVPAELPPLTPGGALREAQFAIFESETKLREAAREQ